MITAGIHIQYCTGNKPHLQGNPVDLTTPRIKNPAWSVAAKVLRHFLQEPKHNFPGILHDPPLADID